MIKTLVNIINGLFPPPAPLSEAEQALLAWGIKYTKQKDGMIVVKGFIDISHMNLKKLPDLTKVIVKGGFWCQHNKLTSLTGAPAVIGGSFSCAANQLTSLEGAPSSVGGDFHCYSNQLTSLECAPSTVGEGFWCRDNQLTSLEGAPQKFKILVSSFGEFASWNDVPENLRVSPETKEKTRQKAEEKRLEMHHKIAAASVQKQAFKPAPSICFKTGPK